MTAALFDDHGVRFEYPSDWELDAVEDGPVTTLTLQSSGGPAFVIVTLDESRPDPADMVDEAMAAMREEYPLLDAVPALETIDGNPAVGHDVDFISLDITSSCAIRCYRTARRTVLIFGQWSDLEADDPESLIRALRQSMEETDA